MSFQRPYRSREWIGIGLLLAAPFLHPVLLPWVGVASHLLWWTHVLPVALITHRMGRRGALAMLPVSVLLLIAGERIFGAGYGVPADWHTTLSLAAALTFTNLLVVGFALHARAIAGRYHLLFGKADFGIIRTDAEGRMLAINPAARKWLGARDDCLGARLTTLPALSGIPSPAAIERAGAWSGKLETPGLDGVCQELHFTVVSVSQDEPPGHQILLMDRTVEITQQAEMERQARLAALGEGLAGVAHELRNPLSVILAYADMALSEDDASERSDMLSEIRDQGLRIKTLTDELLGFSRPDPEGASVELGEFLRRKIRLEEVTRGFRTRWIDRIQWEGEVPVPAGRLEQIITNLFGNAVDALGPEGGSVEVRSWRDGGNVIVEVADTGPGVDPALGDRIFLPFVTGKSGQGGTGLGLPISRRLARAQGGDLAVRARRSGGAAFVLTLPLAPSEVSESGGIRPEPSALHP